MYLNSYLSKIGLVEMRLETATKLCSVVMALLILPLISLPSWAGEPLRVALNKTSVLRIESNVSNVSIGNPEIADILVESPRLILVVPKKTGETNLLIFDSKNAEIHNFDIIVSPQSLRHLTLYRSTTGVTTFNCDPRCTAVKTPGEPISSGGSSSTGTGGSGAGGLGGLGGLTAAVGG